MVFVVLAGTGAKAQMQLPGAVGGGGPNPPAGAARGSPGAPSGAPPYVPPRPVPMVAPGEAAVAGHVLSRDGTQGEMVFDRSGEGLVLSKLSVAGNKLSRPAQACTVATVLPQPLAAQAGGRPAGAIRYAIPLPACPFNIDILDGAVLVTSPTPTCDYPAADCRVSLDGLWGPPAADITPTRAKELERERVRLETTMRANFRALVRKAGKDRDAVKAIARDQAAFSSEREMTCRDYADETAHGFCSTEVTQARALALLAQFGPVNDAHEHKRPPRPKSKNAPEPDVQAPPP